MEPRCYVQPLNEKGNQIVKDALLALGKTAVGAYSQGKSPKTGNVLPIWEVPKSVIRALLDSGKEGECFLFKKRIGKDVGGEQKFKTIKGTSLRKPSFKKEVKRVKKQLKKLKRRKK